MIFRGPAFRVGVVVLGAALFGCANDECESNQDCPSGLYQCLDNACVLTEFSPPPRPIADGSIATGPPGSGIGTSAGPDAGDAGVDGGPIPDAGDTGMMPGPALSDVEALVQVGLIDEGEATVGLAEARVADYSQSGRTVTVSSPTIEGCVVTERGPGSSVGYTATRIEASNGTSPGSLTINMLPTSMTGEFRNQSMQNPEELLQPRAPFQITFQIVSSGATGTLGPATATTNLPPAPTLTPFAPTGSVISRSLVNLLQIRNEGANVYEVYDADRRTVVECPVTPNTAGIAPFIEGLYRSGSTVTLDIRADAEVQVSVPVIGRGSIPVTFRTTRGLRYFLQIP